MRLFTLALTTACALTIAAHGSELTIDESAAAQTTQHYLVKDLSEIERLLAEVTSGMNIQAKTQPAFPSKETFNQFRFPAITNENTNTSLNTQ